MDEEFSAVSCRLRHGLSNKFQSLASIGVFGQHPSAVTTVSLNLAQAARWVQVAAYKLESLGEHQVGWDSHGGLPLTSEARNITVMAIGWIDQEELPVPAVVLGSAGTVQLEWRLKNNKLEVDLGNGQEIEYFMRDSQGGIVEGQSGSDFGTKLRGLVRKFMDNQMASGRTT